MLKKIIAGAVLGILVGCASRYGTVEWFGKNKSGLLNRAAFDLSCPAAQLQFSPIGDTKWPYEVVGVTGCERKAAYVFALPQKVWVLQADTERTSSN